MASASLWVSRFNLPESILQENVTWVPEADVMVGWGLCHILERMVILLLLG